MIPVEREEKIVALVNKRGVVSVRELADLCDVTAMTIRRDLTRLEARQLLRRTHGGAVSPENAQDPTQSEDEPLDTPDALILAPIQNRAAHTLREHALRNQIPLLAESAPFEGAVYLGPRNFEAAFALGRWAGEYVQTHFDGKAHVLDITQDQLLNTRTRSAGFDHGLRSVLGEHAEILTLHGRGLYNEAYQVAIDALRLHPEINVIFGINDDSVLAGLQAYSDLDRSPDDLLAVNVGGEGKTLFDVLKRQGSLKACLALFPEVVGELAVDAILNLWAGQNVGCELITPHVVLTADNLTEYYTPTRRGWELNRDAVDHLAQARLPAPPAQSDNKRMSFIIHYHTHEWYQNTAKAMRKRAGQMGVTLSVEDINTDLKAAINELYRLIGKVAADYVEDGETIILDTGPHTANMARFLGERCNLTVITNSTAVFDILKHNPEIHLVLTGGELHRETGAFVGRGARLLLREIQADKAFIAAAGLSRVFGISSNDLSSIETRRAMLNAGREVVVLADHTVLGADAHIHTADIEKIDTLITDSGIQSAYRLDFNQLGINVIVAGQVANGGSPCD